MMRGPGAARLLERALTAAASRAGASIAIGAGRATDWQSATFAGQRHEITVEGETGPALDRWLETLAEADLPLAGHLVADIAVASLARNAARTAFVIEALTVEES
ncbi:hypothetical protein [Sphingomonas lycopersici]|uniref:Uncharacterized protein n=1 Tax=Sphingomonas lycopersici TaxID=2951807 RepID=A0AA42CRA0_9SPHN|nr:hypothetical protein [Sphingomonas lycopersici]MCW6535862.1 hypothetical protein [Sphingomonas lycopersici]